MHHPSVAVSDLHFFEIDVDSIWVKDHLALFSQSSHLLFGHLSLHSIDISVPLLMRLGIGQVVESLVAWDAGDAIIARFAESAPTVSSDLAIIDSHVLLVKLVLSLSARRIDCAIQVQGVVIEVGWVEHLVVALLLEMFIGAYGALTQVFSSVVIPLVFDVIL